MAYLYQNESYIMKAVKLWSLCLLFTLTINNIQAQYREVGLVTSASMGIMYGPVLDARPIYKWGKSIARVTTIRAERTYMNYSRYQDNNYFNMSSGFFTGQEWRKPVTDRLYFLHGPEIGMYYSSSINYTNIAPSLRYQFGTLYQVNERFNIALTAPMSLTTSFGKSDGAWNQSALSMGLFSENNLIVLTYAFEKRVRK